VSSGDKPLKRPKIVLIGGGSHNWMPTILKDLLLTPALRDAEFILYDIDRKAAELVARVLGRLRDELKLPAAIMPTDELPRAFKGADYFIITISTGGLKAMAHDIAIPEQYGIYHTVGDTSGPGGWARLMRNFQVFRTLAESINHYAPGAMVLNYTNPMTPLTQALCRVCDGPVVGLCHGLFENLYFLKTFYRIESEDQISVRYAGLNHFFWMTEIRAAGKDLLADLRRRLQRTGFTQLLRAKHMDPIGFHSNRELATELFRLTGVMPYLGDRHTCEFFPGYITNRRNLRKYRLIRTPVASRVAGAKERLATLRRWAKEGQPQGFAVRSRETAADIISARRESRSFIDVGNLPNIGQISNLPLGTVVETAMRVDSNGFSPIAFGALPPVVKGFVEPYVNVFDLGVEACFAGDREMALRALRLDPVCSHLNADQVNEMGQRLLKAHESHMPMFRPRRVRRRSARQR